MTNRGIQDIFIETIPSEGIKLILSYTPINSRVLKDVRMRIIDPVIELPERPSIWEKKTALISGFIRVADCAPGSPASPAL